MSWMSETRYMASLGESIEYCQLTLVDYLNIVIEHWPLPVGCHRQLLIGLDYPLTLRHNVVKCLYMRTIFIVV